MKLRYSRITSRAMRLTPFDCGIRIADCGTKAARVSPRFFFQMLRSRKRGLSNPKSAFRIPHSACRPVGRGQRRAEVFEEAARVGIQKLFDARGIVRRDDQADVVSLAQAEDYLRVVVRRGVGPLLARERDDNACVVVAN